LRETKKKHIEKNLDTKINKKNHVHKKKQFLF
jgi:hypothetical protein